MPKPAPPRSHDTSPFDILAARRRGTTEQADIQTVEQSERSNSQTSAQPSSQTPGTSEHPRGSLHEPAGTRGKRSDPDFQKFTVYIPRTTHRAAKAIANLQGRELSEVVGELLQVYVREQQADALRNL